MQLTDQKTIIKRIAHLFKDAKWAAERKDNLRRENALNKMLAYRTALESCGLTLEEIISLGNSEDLDKDIDILFSQQSK